jgi:hypothetical protein
MGATQGVAGEFAGCSRQTVSRRLRDPAFRRALAVAEQDMHASLVRRVTAEGMAALGRLATRAKDPTVSPAERHQADARILAAAVALLPRRLEADVTVGVAEPQVSLRDWLDGIAARRRASDDLLKPPPQLAATTTNGHTNGDRHEARAR